MAPDLTRTLPDYAGGSILNLAASIAQHFAVDTGHSALTASLPLDGVRRVVLLIVDALGEWQLRHHLDAGNLPALRGVLARNEALVYQLTSTFPSTTVAAVTTLHTGRSPAEHGFVGFTIWLDDRQTVANALFFQDLLTGKPLADPASLMRVPSLYQQMPAAVLRRAVIPASITGSLLSQWHFAGAEVMPYQRLEQLPRRVADALQAPQLSYVAAYWPDYDTAAHLHGPASSQAGQALHSFDAALGQLLDALPRDDQTVILLTADHGQRELDPNEATILNDDAALVSLLASPPMGERCARYFRVQPGRDLVLADQLAPLADVMPMAEVWAAGFFGDPRGAARFGSRTGDLLAIPRDHRQLVWTFSDANRQEIYRGAHGGWTAAEMRVPLIAIRR